jgi:purine-binding chemotaxis protein CheW
MAHVTRAHSNVAHEDQQQYLTFVLGREIYGVRILGIKEILEYQPPTELPMMPACIRGVVNLRGAAVPVVDLCTRFGHPSSPLTKKTCIVIVEVPDGERSQVVGVLVDAVNEVLEIPTADIEPPPAFGTSIHSDFILGMGKVRGRFVILLEEARVLSDADMNVLASQVRAA